MAERQLRKVRPEDARRNNLALVLQELYRHPLSSRADLARRTGLTKVTVSELVSGLLADDLLREVGTSGEPRPGKPSTLLDVNPDGRDIIVCDLSPRSHIRAAITTLRGMPRVTYQHPLNGSVGEVAVTALRDLVSELVAQAERPILGIGIGTPGTVTPEGVVFSAPNLQWSQVPLRETLETSTGLPVAIENDANLATFAEWRFGTAPADIVRVQLSGGVGAGVLIDGKIVRGRSGDAGEIGHVVIDNDGPRCSCGKLGCLESWASVPAIRAHLEAHPEESPRSLRDAGVRIGRALAPVVGMLGLHRIIIGGPDNIVTGTLLDAASGLINDRTRSDFRPEVTLTASTLGEDAVLLGAVALVLARRLHIT